MPKPTPPRTPPTGRPPVPINEAEAIIDPFWDERLSPISHYRLRNGRASRPARVAQLWCFVTLSWGRAPAARPRGRGAARPLLALERRTRVNLAGYDRLIVRIACPRHVTVSAFARVDGVERRVFDREPGRGGPREFEGPIRGSVLDRLRIEVSSQADGADEIWLYWIGCANRRSRKAMLGRKPPFNAAWEGWLLPETAPVEFAPRLGLFFDARELEAIRRRALSPLYRPIMDQLRAYARAAMRDPRTPESQVGPLLASGDVWAIQVRERDADTRSFHIDAPVCAFVGLVDRDPECLRFAARIAVSLAHTSSWTPHFMQGFPGSTFDTRAFPEAFVTAGLALALDWAGSWFTPNGEHLVRYAIATKGLPRVREAFLQYEYMWHCNQHHMIGLGRILGLLVLQKAWPRTAAEIDVFERDLLEIIDLYIKPDGSSDEGVGYWSNSFRTSIPSLAALARHRGRDLRSMVPAKLGSMGDYIASFLSTAGEPGSYHPVSDTVGDSVAVDAIGMMAAALDAPLWQGLLADCLTRGKKVKRDWSFDGFFTVIHGPDSLPGERVALPAFTKLSKAGSASSFRMAGADGIRLFLVGAGENAGHGHRDKGSFILEAGGEAFAIDRGAVPYEDAANLPFMKTEVAHNLAVPEGCVQRNPSPVASDWDASGDGVRLHGRIDTSGTWQPPVLACRRTIDSPTPRQIDIVDEFELAEPKPVSFLLHSPLPIEVVGGRALIRGARLTLEIAADWCSSGAAAPCGVNWTYTPINRLELVSAPGRLHRLVTRLLLKPTA